MFDILEKLNILKKSVQKKKPGMHRLLSGFSVIFIVNSVIKLIQTAGQMRLLLSFRSVCPPVICCASSFMTVFFPSFIRGTVLSAAFCFLTGTMYAASALRSFPMCRNRPACPAANRSLLESRNIATTAAYFPKAFVPAWRFFCITKRHVPP